MYFLEDDVIGLRSLTTEDAEVEGGYRDWFNNPEVCKHNSHHRFPMSLSNVIAYIDTCNCNHTSIVLAVDLKEGKKHIGNISLQQIDLINRQAEIAFIFGYKNCWGKGYATKAATLLINHGFSELGLNRIYFGTSEMNIMMQKLGGKLGFRKCGTKRKAFFKNNEFYDIYEYDLLREEWI